MAKYRKLPVVIDAIQWTGANPIGIGEWMEQWPSTFPNIQIHDDGEIDILTLEDGKDARAKHVVSIGDFIIRGVKGEFYACKPDIFFLTYELV